MQVSGIRAEKLFLIIMRETSCDMGIMRNYIEELERTNEILDSRLQELKARLQELTYQKEKIIQRVNEALGDKVIKEVVIN